MLRFQAFKYELIPTGEQQRDMRRFAGSCRFVFNKALALQKERYERGEKRLGYAGLCKLLTGWRNGAETPWLADSPTHPLQQALKDLERAYTNFFARRAGYPRFKKKGQSESFRYPAPKQIKLDQSNGRIFLPKLGWLRYRNSRDVLGAVKQVTVSARGGRWFVSIQTEREVTQPVPNGGAVGIDMGIARFATLSDGTFYSPLNSFKRHETALRKVQQTMSRKAKFSNNWKKAKARVQRIHSRIGNARRDYLHKITTTISQNHAMVCIEDLQVRNMSRSAAGTIGKPGKNVRAKSGLNKSIVDQGWFEFRRQLGYKLAWSGGYLIAVSPQNTSRTCREWCSNAASSRNPPKRLKDGPMPPLSAVGISGFPAGEDVKQDLKTTTARAMCNHNTTRGVWFYMYAGAKGTAYSGILPGQDDEAVAYHSSGGVAGSSGGSYCNSSDWLCNDLTLGTSANEGGSAKWSYHSVSFRDDSEAYNHYTSGNWQGIVSVVRNAMVNSAL